MVVVENERGEVVDSSVISNQNLNVLSRDSNLSFGRSQPRETVFFQDKSKTVSYLNPVYLNGQQLQQVVIEEMD